MGIKSTSDLGKVAAGVNIVLPAGQGNQPVITIRGIGINDNNSNNAGSAGVYVDEFYLSAPTSQTLSLYDLNRVEVLEGPQGTLYGRNTSVGAINIVTAQPTDDFGGYVRGTVGNYGSYSVESAVSGQIIDGLDGRISFDRNYSDGYFKNLGTGNTQNGADDYEIRGQLLYKPGADLKISLTTSFATVDRLPDLYQHLGAFVPGTQYAGGKPGTGYSGNPTICPVSLVLNGGCVDLFGAPSGGGFYQSYGWRTQHLRATDFGQTGRLDYTLGDLTLSSLSQYHFNQRFLPEDTTAAPYRLLDIDYFNKSDEYTQEFRVRQDTENYNWVGGFYYLHEQLEQNQTANQFLDYDNFFGAGSGNLANNGNNIDALVPLIYNGNNLQITDSYALYGQGEYKILDDLKFILGARVTDEDRSFHVDATARYQTDGINNFGPEMSVIDTNEALHNKAFNYRAGLNYTPAQDMLLYASIATGFKSGDFNGGFLSNDPAVAKAQTAPVGPERVTTYEAGYKSQLLDRRVTFNVSSYYNDYRDLQIFALVNELVGSSYQVVNTLTSAKKAESYGADIELDARPIPDLRLGSRISLLNTKLNEYGGADPQLFQGRQLPFAPQISAFLTADYNISIGAGELDLQLNATYKSQQQLTSSADPLAPQYAEQPDYWLEGARLSYNLGRYEVAAYVNNLSNTHYYSTSFDAIEPFGFQQFVVGQPRTFGLEARVDF